MKCWWVIGIVLGCFAGSLQAQVSYEVKPISVNLNTADEFAPVYYKDGIVFSSNRKNGVWIQYDDVNQKPLTELYYAALKRGRKFESPSLFARELSTIFHDGPASFNAAGTLVAFTRNNKVGKKFGNYLEPDNKLGIYFADHVDGKWVNVRAFAHNRPEHNYGHPALSPDGNTLYFISKVRGGMGGLDVYYTQYIDGVWVTPTHLKAPLNSKQ